MWNTFALSISFRQFGLHLIRRLYEARRHVQRTNFAGWAHTMFNSWSADIDIRSQASARPHTVYLNLNPFSDQRPYSCSQLRAVTNANFNLVKSLASCRAFQFILDAHLTTTSLSTSEFGKKDSQSAVFTVLQLFCNAVSCLQMFWGTQLFWFYPTAISITEF